MNLFLFHHQMSTPSVARDLELDLSQKYKLINKTYKSITRELVDDIVRKFDDIADVYIDNSHLTTKEKESLNDALLTKKILNNGDHNEAASIATILNFILNMFLFMKIYESDEPERLFKGYTLSDWLMTSIHKASLSDVINNPNMNDENIINTFNRFNEITDDDVFDLMKKAIN